MDQRLVVWLRGLDSAKTILSQPCALSFEYQGLGHHLPEMAKTKPNDPRLQAARSIIEALQYAKPCCPMCHWTRVVGHKPDCPIAAFLSSIGASRITTSDIDSPG
jgi:hypothetical protein